MPNSSPTPKTLFDTCIPKFSQVQTHVVSTLLKWEAEKELQRIFQKGAIFYGEHLKITDYYKYCITDPKTFVQFGVSTTGFAMK